MSQLKTENYFMRNINLIPYGNEFSISYLLLNNYVLNGVGQTIRTNDDCLNEDCLNPITSNESMMPGGM